MGLQLLMLLEVFFSNGGQFSGIYLLLGPMRNTQRLLHLTLRLVWKCFIAYFLDILVLTI